MTEAVSFSEKLMILYHSASHAFPKESKLQEMLLNNYFIIAQYLSLIISFKFKVSGNIKGPVFNSCIITLNLTGVERDV